MVVGVAVAQGTDPDAIHSNSVHTVVPIAEVLAKIVIRERTNVVDTVMHHLVIGDSQVMIPQIRSARLMMMCQEIGIPRANSVRQVMVRQTLILQARVVQRSR